MPPAAAPGRGEKLERRASVMEDQSIEFPAARGPEAEED